jgi:peptide/nickel transport system permease protein
MAYVAEVEPGLLARFLRGRKWYGTEWYMTVTGGFIVLFIVVLTVLTFLTPRLAPYDPESRVGDPFTPPSAQHIFGTDQLGRDIFSRIIYGAQIVLQVALLSAVFSLVVGVPLGLLSGFLGGRLDRVLSLVMDSIYSFPGLILAIALAALLGAGVLNMSVAIAVVYVPIFYRLVRGQVLSIKEELYVEAARSLGARGRTILWRYIFPNVIPSIVVVFSLNIADAIITEAGLAFIGLGVDPSRPDWGYDIYRGRSELVGGRWWPVTFPGLAIALVALGFSMFGEGLSEILNPRLTEA